MAGRSLERAVAALAEGGVVAFTGAGISADSGVPTFRDPGGLWDRFDPERFGTWEGLAAEAMAHPDRLADFLGELRASFGRAGPNAAHRAIAELERAGLLTAVITQNVDGLHQEAGSLHVVEIHGSLHRRVCLVCGTEDRVTRAEFLRGLARAIAGLRTAFVPSLESVLPRCHVCGGPTRPGFVAFGERPLRFEEASARAATCAAMLVVGTAGEVESRRRRSLAWPGPRGRRSCTSGPARRWSRPTSTSGAGRPGSSRTSCGGRWREPGPADGRAADWLGLRS